MLVDENNDDDYVFPQEDIECLVIGGGSDNCSTKKRPASNLEISNHDDESQEEDMGDLDNVINEIQEHNYDKVSG